MKRNKKRLYKVIVASICAVTMLLAQIGPMGVKESVYGVIIDGVEYSTAVDYKNEWFAILCACKPDCGLVDVVVPVSFYTKPRSYKIMDTQREVFKDVTTLKSAEIYAQIPYLRENFFAGCTSLERVVLPDSIWFISEGAFKDCTSLKTLYIPRSVTGIHKKAFEGSGLQGEIYVNCEVFLGKVSVMSESDFPSGVTVKKWHNLTEMDNAYSDAGHFGTCKVCGEVVSAPHTYDSACQEKCNECDYVRTAVTHTYAATESGCKCTVCGKETEHDFGADGTGDECLNCHKKNINASSLENKIHIEEIIYNGYDHVPTITVDGLEEGTDYEITCSDKRNAGDYTATITGKGEYYGEKELNWSIQKRELTPVVERYENPEKVYDGTTNLSSNLLVYIKYEGFPTFNFDDEDYQGDVLNQITEERTKITAVWETGYYASPDVGEEIDITIEMGELYDPFEVWDLHYPENYVRSTDTIILPKAGKILPASQDYQVIPEVESCICQVLTLVAKEGCEYSIDGTNYQDSPVFEGVKEGKAYTIYQRLKAKTNYAASSPTTLEYTIPANQHSNVAHLVQATTKADGKSYKVCDRCGKESDLVVIPAAKTATLSYQTATYTGSAIKPTIVLTTADNKKIDSKNYTVAYKNNTKSGTATVEITLKNQYKGTITKTFKILPKTAETTGASYNSGSISVTWKKAGGATGYEIWRATKEKGTYTKVATIKKASTVTYKDTNVTHGKTYYYKVRSFATVSEKTYNGKDSKVVNATVYTNTEAFVARIYTQALGREPEAAGLAYWTKEINNKSKTPVWVAELFIFSDEFTKKNLNDTEYIKVLYRTFMGREYDQAGLNYWLSQIKAGKTRKQVLESFAGCPEFQNIIKSFGL